MTIAICPRPSVVTLSGVAMAGTLVITSRKARAAAAHTRTALLENRPMRARLVVLDLVSNARNMCAMIQAAKANVRDISAGSPMVSA